jgi:hypothetical protein
VLTLVRLIVAQASLAGEALDVAIGQTPDVGADDERLERSRPDDRAGVGDDRADEPGEGAADLGHRDRDLALGGLDPAGTMAVARARRLRRPRVAGPTEEGRDFLFHGTLDHEPGAQAAELAQSVGVIEPVEQDRLDGGLDPEAWRYSSFHGVVSFCGLPRSASEPTPSSLVQRGQDATRPAGPADASGVAVTLRPSKSSS